MGHPKVCTLRFRNFRHSRPPSPFHNAQICSYPTTPPPPPPPLVQTQTYGYFCQIRYDRDIFGELISIKKPQPLQNKDTTVQSCRKMSNQNTKKSPVDWSCTFQLYGGGIGMDHFGCLNNSLLLYFYFIIDLQKKLWRTYACSWTSILPP